jgi:regulator of sirC expression with transglutaminase-like and TPR domain
MPHSEAQRRFADAVRRPEDEIDLVGAALAFARVEHPDLDEPACRSAIAEVAARAADAVAAESEPRRRVRALAAAFADAGFDGNRDDYYDPANSYLHEVVRRRRGLPISLSAVLIEVGRSAGVPLYGVALPAHFMVKWQDGEDELFLDPFHGCEVLDEKACRARIRAMVGGRMPLAPMHFARVGPRAILRRMLNNLRGIHLQRRDLPRAVRTVELLLVLDPDAPGDLRDLGLLYRYSDRDREAVVCLERYLELAPNAPDAETVRRNLEMLQRRTSGRGPEDGSRDSAPPRA